MNVLSIPKQIDNPLIYTNHALLRAEQRNVPIPNYIPFGTKCVYAESRESKQNVYVLQYDYFGTVYQMVVSEKNVVLTVCMASFQPYIRNLIINESKDIKKQLRYMKLSLPKVKATRSKVDKYKHLEIQNGIEEYYNYA